MSADYSHLVVNRGNPAEQRILAAPRRARVVTDTYGAPGVLLELDVVATSPGWGVRPAGAPGAGPVERLDPRGARHAPVVLGESRYWGQDA